MDVQERKIIPDRKRADSLRQLSLKKLCYLSSMTLSSTNTEIMFTLYYDCMRQIVESRAISLGIKIVHHEDCTSFLKQEGFVNESHLFDRCRKLRNRIQYYGKALHIDLANQAIEDMKHLLKRLR